MEELLHMSDYMDRTKDEARNTIQGHYINATGPRIKTLIKPSKNALSHFIRPPYQASKSRSRTY
jgi:hypothetical protein